MPVFVGNSTVNTAVANSTITVDQTQNFAYATSNRNSIRPSLNLDFTRSQTVDPRITFTRASSGTYFNSRGVLTTATNNVPRIDYNPITGACNGLLVEKESTNLIKNNTMVGAVLSASVAAQTISSITFSGTTATVTTAAPHGLINYSAGVIISGAAPSNYNGTYTVQTTPTPTTFTYIMRTTPATNATVVGSYTASSFGLWPNFWATFTTNSGVPYQIIGTGSSNGISYVDVRFYGVPNAATGAYSVICMNYDSAVGVPITAGTQYTSGFYCSNVGGSTAGVSVIGIDTRWDVGGVSTTNIISSLTSTLTRFSATATAPTGASKVYPSFVLNYTDNVAVDITLRFGLPQFELGTAATSVITTTAATATRAIEVASVNIQNYFNTTQGSIAMGFIQNYPTATGAFPWGLFSLQDAAASNSSRARIGGSGSTLIIFDSFSASGSDTGQTTSNSWNLGGLNKIGLSWSYASLSSYNKIYALNGISGSATPAIALPANNNILYIGAWNNATFPLTGWVQGISYYPIALSNTELQTLTS